MSIIAMKAIQCLDYGLYSSVPSIVPIDTSHPKEKLILADAFIHLGDFDQAYTLYSSLAESLYEEERNMSERGLKVLSAIGFDSNLLKYHGTESNQFYSYSDNSMWLTDLKREFVSKGFLFVQDACENASTYSFDSMAQFKAGYLLFLSEKNNELGTSFLPYLNRAIALKPDDAFFLAKRAEMMVTKQPSIWAIGSFFHAFYMDKSSAGKIKWLSLFALSCIYHSFEICLDFFPAAEKALKVALEIMKSGVTMTEEDSREVIPFEEDFVNILDFAGRSYQKSLPLRDFIKHLLTNALSPDGTFFDTTWLTELWNGDEILLKAVENDNSIVELVLFLSNFSSALNRLETTV